MLSLMAATSAGANAASAHAHPDLLADTNRSGTIEAADEPGKNMLAAQRGALFLPNLDDDSRRCHVTRSHDELYGSDEDRDTGGGKAHPKIDRELAECNDASDDVVNGPADALDLAPLQTAAMEQVPGDATGRVSLVGEGGQHARLFIRHGDEYVPASGTSLTADELRKGVQLGLEGKDIIRDRTVWDGSVQVRFSVSGTGSDGTDEVTLKVAPVLLQNDLLSAQRVFAGGEREPDAQASGTPENADETPVPLDVDFHRTLEAALEQSGGVPLTTFRVGDPWTQDYFEPAWASVPGADGRPHVMRLMLRSANVDAIHDHEASLRTAGRVLYEKLLGPDVGVIVQYSTDLPDSVDDSLNSMGNLDALPPYPGFSNGRILLGSTADRQSDPSLRRMLADQGAQPQVVLDTSWLNVGHVDETTHVVRADNARGWTIAVADPRLAAKLLADAQHSGHGEAQLFAGLLGDTEGASSTDPAGTAGSQSGGSDEAASKDAARSIDAVLGDHELMDRNEEAAQHIDRQIATLLTATGLQADELVRIPVLFTGKREDVFEDDASDRASSKASETGSADGGSSVKDPAAEGSSHTDKEAQGPMRYFAYTPGMVNGLTIDPTHFAAPDPHGPVIDGHDILKAEAERALARNGVAVKWVEDYNWLHVGEGEVHCGTNAWRDVQPIADWWKR